MPNINPFVHQSSSGGATYNIIELTTPGTGTWVKPANLLQLYVCCVGAGGGGASGDVSAGNGSGGKGGGGAAVSWRVLRHDQLPPSVGYEIGAGGAGGAGSTSSTFNAGQKGGDTIFGTASPPFTRVSAEGGSGGVNRTQGGNPGIGDFNAVSTNFTISGITGQVGGIVSNGSNGSSSGFEGAGINGGAGGAGKGASSSFFGGAGGRTADENFVRSAAPARGTPGGNTADGGDGANGLNNVSKQISMFFDAAYTTIGAGSSGAGGGSTWGAGFNGGKGGDGGNHGAGGGGGGSCASGTSGAGGKGGDGCILLIEILS